LVLRTVNLCRVARNGCRDAGADVRYAHYIAPGQRVAFGEGHSSSRYMGTAAGLDAGVCRMVAGRRRQCRGDPARRGVVSERIPPRHELRAVAGRTAVEAPDGN